MRPSLHIRIDSSVCEKCGNTEVKSYPNCFSFIYVERRQLTNADEVACYGARPEYRNVTKQERADYHLVACQNCGWYVTRPLTPNIVGSEGYATEKGGWPCSGN